MNLRFFYDIPTDNKTLVEYAKRHLGNCIDFSTYGGTCPEVTCVEGPFPNSEILFLHILIHKKLRYLCEFCPEAFSQKKLLTKHFQKEHSTIDKNTFKFNGDILDLLSKKWTYLQVWPTYIGYPTICRYIDNAPIFLVCQFPETAKLIDTEFELKHALQICFDSAIYPRVVRCPFKRTLNPCNREFRTCKELLLHVTAHFGIRGFCLLCLRFYKSVNVTAELHSENVHFVCFTCGIKSTNLNEQLFHKAEFNHSFHPYKNIPAQIDTNCELYLPKYAFHHRSIHRMSTKDARYINHPCLYLTEDLLLKLNNINFAIEIDWRFKECLINCVIDTTWALQCPFELCLFEYSTCREIFVHTLLTHSTIGNYTYICNLCLSYFNKTGHLRKHLMEMHSNMFVCHVCLLSYDNNLDLLCHQHTVGHVTLCV